MQAQGPDSLSNPNSSVSLQKPAWTAVHYAGDVRSESQARRYATAPSGEEMDDDWMIQYDPPQAALEQMAPNFKAPAVIDNEITKISLSDYRGKWVVLVFYPKDFTFVCPTELIAFSDAQKEFESINTQIIGISTDTEESHLAWIKLPRNKGGLGSMNYPLVADTTKAITARYGTFHETLGIAYRGLFIIDPEGKIQQITLNNLDIGRDVQETKRLVQALQHVREYGTVCPAGWKPGQKDMKGDVKGSLEYFESQYGTGAGEEADEIAPSIKKLRSMAEIKEFISNYPYAVIDYYAPWCGKCRQVGPHIEKLAKKHEKQIHVAKVDVDAPGLKDALAEDVTSLPTFRFYKSGSLVPNGEVVGYKPNVLETQFNALLSK